MSFDLATHRKSRPGRPIWSGAAFIVEALLLLVFLVASLAIFTQLFAASAGKAAESRELSQAVSVASNMAEQFAADPASVSTVTELDNLIVVCDTTDERRENGVLHHATITVYERGQAASPESVSTGEPLYSVTTANYESEVTR